MARDALTHTETVAIISGRRYGVPPRVRQNAIDFIERLLDDEDAGTGNKLKAVECLLKMDLVDIAAEKDTAATTATAATPSVVLLLPPNGTEYNVDR